MCDDGAHAQIEVENQLLPNPYIGFHIDPTQDVKLYKVGSDYVADTADNDGDGVPNTWDAFPDDDRIVGDVDGDGYADRDDAFPRDETRHESTMAGGTPNNNVHSYHHCCSNNGMELHVDGAANLEVVLGAGSYKAQGRLVKLLLGEAKRWDDNQQAEVVVSDAEKFVDVLFVVDSIHPHGASSNYSMHLVPADGSDDISGLGDFGYSLENSSWVYKVPQRRRRKFRVSGPYLCDFLWRNRIETVEKSQKFRLRR